MGVSDSLQTPWDAARTSGSRKCWQPHLYGPNDALVSGYNTVLSRARDSFRNNAWISRAVNVITVSEVGDGIRAKNVSKDMAYRDEWQGLWDEFIESCDVSGAFGLDQIVDQCVTERVVAGGAFIRFVRPRKRKGDNSIPLKTQMLAVEQVPISGATPHLAENQTVCGIEFTPNGRLYGYHVYESHPEDSTSTHGSRWSKHVSTRFIRARDMTHHYMPQRIGQVREPPALAAALDRARASGDYDQFELDRKKTKSMFTGTLERDVYADEDYQFDPISGAPIKEDVFVPEVNLRAGMMLNLLPGERANMFNADNTADGFDDYVRYQNLALASAAKVPYELVTGDYSRINDRIIRTILDDLRRGINKNLRLYTIPQIVRRLAYEFSDTLQMAGILTRPDYFTNRRKYTDIIYTPQPFPYVHPTQDRQGVKMDLEMGLTNRTRECQKRRIDRESLDSETQEERRDEESKGLNFDFRYTDFETLDNQP